MKMLATAAPRVFSAVLALALLVTAGACSTGKEARPNLLIIVSDALRADVLGCYGGAARTPNIDRLAGDGTLFVRCYSTTPWTWPAAVSMFTGNYPAAYHPTVERLFPETRPEAESVTVWYVPEEEQLVGEVMGAAGYDVRMALQNPLPRRSNSLQGFLDLDPAVVTAPRRVAVEHVRPGRTWPCSTIYCGCPTISLSVSSVGCSTPTANTTRHCGSGRNSMPNTSRCPGNTVITPTSIPGS